MGNVTGEIGSLELSLDGVDAFMAHHRSQVFVTEGSKRTDEFVVINRLQVPDIRSADQTMTTFETIEGINDTPEHVTRVTDVLDRALCAYVNLTFAKVGDLGRIFHSTDHTSRRQYIASASLYALELFERTSSVYGQILFSVIQKAAALKSSQSRLKSLSMRMTKLGGCGVRNTPVTVDTASGALGAGSAFFGVQDRARILVLGISSVYNDAPQAMNLLEVGLAVEPIINGVIHAQSGEDLASIASEAMSIGTTEEVRALRKQGMCQKQILAALEVHAHASSTTPEASAVQVAIAESVKEINRRFINPPASVTANIKSLEQASAGWREAMTTVMESSDPLATTKNMLAMNSACTYVDVVLELMSRLSQSALQAKDAIVEVKEQSAFYDAHHPSRAAECGTNQQPATVLTDEEALYKLTSLGPYPITAASHVKLGVHELNRRVVETFPKEVFTEEKLVAFGAQSMPSSAQSTDQGVKNLLFKVGPSDRWRGTGREAMGIDTPWASLYMIRTVAEGLGWLKSMFPVTGVTPPPLSSEQISQLTDEQRAVYYIVFKEVGNDWNRAVMDKHRAMIQQFRDKAFHCQENNLTIENSTPSAHGAVHHWGSDTPVTSDTATGSEPASGPLEEVMAHVAEIQSSNDALTAEVAAMKKFSAAQSAAAAQATEDALTAEKSRLEKVDTAVQAILSVSSDISQSQAESMALDLHPPLHRRS
uniref:Uncharacterized protein n=1 Tax=Octactis speculum TaxID=3111310 RepID=A0A7S2BX77_9STRA|mmetsp:Transcript_28704/g.39147  ORF Transcript_28704/g.39147 Transcript_28704/m.39147 type:complete len:710 (+) Transcript_28704:908-3037(+)